MHLDIVFRSCSRSDQKRYIDVPKSELLLGCLNSLMRSAKLAVSHDPRLSIRLHVLDDHSDPATVERIKALLRTPLLWRLSQKLARSARFETVFIPLDDTGQSASMLLSCDYAKRNCSELIYFVEDDYLHAKSAVEEMLEARALFSANTGRDVIISPCDHSVEYRGELIVPTRVVLGSRRHWRVARGTTSTYLISRDMLLKYWGIYTKHATYPQHAEVCEDNTINLIYQIEPCFSPVPSLSAHVSHPSLQPLYVDWQAWWEQSKV